MPASRPEPPESPIDPEDMLRAMLRISPEDAAKVREAASRAMTNVDDDEDDDGGHPS